MKTSLLLLTVLGTLGTAACVPQARYDASVRDAQQAHADAMAAHSEASANAADRATARAELAKLNAQIAELEARAKQRDQDLASAQGSAHDLQAKVDGSIAENEQLRKELSRLGKNADALLAEKGSLASALAEAKARLEELRRAQAAADARLALYRQIALKFQKMVDAGELKVALRNGHMVLQLANDVLFDSGRTEIKATGQGALRQVATVLKTITDRHFQVAGDTDNVPIQTAMFPSNWELSTRRAVEVVRFLVAQGMRAQELSAAGYGEFDPIAPNESAEGRAKNRRIEITLEPNINELVALPAGL